MIQRCHNPNYHHFYLYGGRGIVVCNEWRNDYVAFREWALKNGYDANAQYGKCTIDRIDVNGNYEPNNCRFVSMMVQSKNKREGFKSGRRPWKFYEYNGKQYTCKQLSELAGIKESTMSMRLTGEGMTPEEAVTLGHNEHRKGKDIQKRFYKPYAIS
jgi:hypothetical protein